MVSSVPNLSDLYRVSQQYKTVWVHIYTPNGCSGVSFQVPCSSFFLRSAMSDTILSAGQPGLGYLTLHQADQPSLSYLSHEPDCLVRVQVSDLVIELCFTGAK